MGASKKSFTLLQDAVRLAGFDFRRSTPQERQEDIDLVIWPVGFPQKAAALTLKNTLLKKSKKRKHLWGWVELQTKEGRPGWLYKKFTYVAYERKGDFALIHKKDLRNWIEKENFARWDLPFVKNSWGASYRLFRRKDTKEAIFQIKVKDALVNCRHLIWNKDERNS